MATFDEIDADDAPEFRLAGKGKHAKRIDFTSLDELDLPSACRIIDLSSARVGN